MLLKAFLCMQQLSIFCDLFFSAFFLMQVFWSFYIIRGQLPVLYENIYLLNVLLIKNSKIYLNTAVASLYNVLFHEKIMIVRVNLDMQ